MWDSELRLLALVEPVTFTLGDDEIDIVVRALDDGHNLTSKQQELLERLRGFLALIQQKALERTPKG